MQAQPKRVSKELDGDGAEGEEDPLSLLGRLKRDCKLPLVIFVIAFLVSMPTVTNMIAKYLPFTINGSCISLAGVALNALLIAVLAFVAQKFIN